MHYSLVSLLFFLSVASCDDQEECQSFLRRHAPLLSSWPALFIQQALNEPLETTAHTWAQGMMGQGGVRVVEWLNNDGRILQETW